MHVDTKKLLPDPGRLRPQRPRSGSASQSQPPPGPGYAYLHNAIDDFSRLA